MPTNQQIVHFGSENLYVNSFYNGLDSKTGIINFVDSSVKGYIPFPGLRSFNLSESNLFFGRDDQIYQLIDYLENDKLILLHSNAEGGKTSLLKAGLIPSLLAGDMPTNGIKWKLAYSNPGYTPIENLTLSLCKSVLKTNNHKDVEDELLKIIQPEKDLNPKRIVEYYIALQSLCAKNGENLLIVIDQLEEIFLYPEAQYDAKEYLKLIAELFKNKLSNTFFVIACDSQQLNRSNTLFSYLPEHSYKLHLLPNLEKSQIIYAVNGPLKQIKKNISPGLLRTILDEIKEESTPLPLLQFILNQLTVVSSGPIIDFPNYIKIGDFSDCFNKYVNKIISNLNEEDIAIASTLFSLFSDPSSSRKISFDLVQLNINMNGISKSVRKMLVLLEKKGLIRKLAHLQKIEPTSTHILKKSAILRGWVNQSSSEDGTTYKSHKFI